MEEHPNHEVDVVFVGHTGVGKSSLINMIMGGKYVAKESSDARPCTTHTTSYSAVLEPGLRCRLWDTRGLGEAVDHHSDRTFRSRLADLMAAIRQIKGQQARELKETLRDRTRQTRPILIWCMDAAKIDVAVHWEDFRKVYVEYCERKATPVVVVNQMRSEINGWENKCRIQIEEKDLGEGPNNTEVRLIRVRKYHNASTPSYVEDSRALKSLISDLIKHANQQL